MRGVDGLGDFANVGCGFAFGLYGIGVGIDSVAITWREIGLRFAQMFDLILQQRSYGAVGVICILRPWYMDEDHLKLLVLLHSRMFVAR